MRAVSVNDSCRSWLRRLIATAWLPSQYHVFRSRPAGTARVRTQRRRAIRHAPGQINIRHRTNGPGPGFAMPPSAVAVAPPLHAAFRHRRALRVSVPGGTSPVRPSHSAPIVPRLNSVDFISFDIYL
ncbi:hypothetical protein X962_5877 [Burkholderia pseudomallei MSHR7343]|nr:hypothetical protein X962_5877 [Burkholderia pseudomallei MSHR7343]